jgi:hypothetical protein
MKPASINLRKLVLSPTGLINLGFILREDLLLCSSYLPLGVPNWAVIYTPPGANHLVEGDAVDSLANRAKIRLSAEDWNTIKAAIEHGTI